MTYQTLHAYYRKQQVLPTYGRFCSVADLDAHAALRAQLFEDKLRLPLRLFDNARLLEFGPDSGENALVFARWGSRCTLVEPNPSAHAFIREYFERYGLADSLAGVLEADVAAFSAGNDAKTENDFVIAEGFIYTVQPTTLWVDVIKRLLRPGGHAVISYCEAFGSWVELLTKMVHAQVKRLTGRGAADAATAAFGARWDTIPHMRSFESWVVDVLENPFVRLRYFLEPAALCGAMEAAGLVLHASWPAYRNELDVYWHKRTLPDEERVRSRREFLARSRLSHMFGTALFLDSAVHEPALRAAVETTDALIDDFTQAGAERLRDALRAMRHILAGAIVYAAPGGITRAVAAVDSFDVLLDRLAAGDAAGTLNHCRTNEAFLTTWGQPYHFAAFRA